MNWNPTCPASLLDIHFQSADYLFYYKLLSILVGAFIIYLGYRLFSKRIASPAGDLEAEGKGMKLYLKGAAPGIFFALFGAFVICFSLYRGLEYKEEAKTAQHPSPQETRDDKPSLDSIMK